MRQTVGRAAQNQYRENASEDRCFFHTISQKEELT